MMKDNFNYILNDIQCVINCKKRIYKNTFRNWFITFLKLSFQYYNGINFLVMAAYGASTELTGFYK